MPGAVEGVALFLAGEAGAEGQTKITTGIETAAGSLGHSSGEAGEAEEEGEVDTALQLGKKTGLFLFLSK